uniref:Pentraxin (PTX) domain-containing protein n=1 Tax=Mola mola TaxID=94237 RepID=A0A3Q3W7D2_MOLML
SEDNVEPMTSTTKFKSVTVCLRDRALLSMVTRSYSTCFVLFQANKSFKIKVGDQEVQFLSVSIPCNTWHSVCDSKPTFRGDIDEAPIILGQIQDNYGEGLDKNQCFIGLITDVHMSDNVLPPDQIKLYMTDDRGKGFTPGNVLNWRNLAFRISGMVFMEDKVTPCVTFM